MKGVFFSFISFCSTLIFAFDATIPVLHLPDFYDDTKQEEFLEKLENAMHEVGFFALTGTGVDPKVLDQAYEEAKAFFSKDFDQKILLTDPNGQRGYTPGESAKGEKRKDFKEFYHIGMELSEEDHQRLEYPYNLWPQDSENFKTTMQQLYQVLHTCTLDLCSVFSKALKQKDDFVAGMLEEGNSLMRLLHYPKNPPKDAIWGGAHTDINFFTILPRATARGLQVLNAEGNWIDVIVPDGAFIINCADMLENLSNGYYKSSVHRVVDPGLKQERFSIVFFAHPRSTDRLDPLAEFITKTGGIRRYANVNAFELLVERLIDLGLASKDLMEFFIDSGAIERLEEVNRFSPKAKEILQKAGYLQ